MVKSIFICFFIFRFSINSNVLVMQFKGTKEKWIVNINEELYNTFILNNELQPTTYKEEEYNALLISKAPEMLEMLKILIENIEEEGNYSRQTGYDLEEAKQLIKQATDL